MIFSLHLTVFKIIGFLLFSKGNTIITININILSVHPVQVQVPCRSCGCQWVVLSSSYCLLATYFVIDVAHGFLVLLSLPAWFYGGDLSKVKKYTITSTIYIARIPYIYLVPHAWDLETFQFILSLCHMDRYLLLKRNKFRIMKKRTGFESRLSGQILTLYPLHVCYSMYYLIGLSLTFYISKVGVIRSAL